MLGNISSCQLQKLIVFFLEVYFELLHLNGFIVEYLLLVNKVLLYFDWDQKQILIF
jgi:hypothetical protein